MTRLTRQRMGVQAIALVATVCTGCGVSIAETRSSPGSPVLEREIRAGSAVSSPVCSPRWRYLAPGMGRLCRGQTQEGLILLGLTAAELGAMAMAVERHGFELDHPAVKLPLIGLQDLWLYDNAITLIEEDRALRRPFTPQDNMAELAWAPFNPEVMKRPHVLLSIVGATVAAASITHLMDDTSGGGDGDVNYFGRQLDPAIGYPLAGATFGALFTHVAMAEEALFRGQYQSAFARSYGETNGWVLASLLFGAAHLPNAAFLRSRDDRRQYITIAVPFITAVGGLVGLNYRWADYSLTAPVAVHFWYNLLISATQLVRDPGNSMLSASVRIPF